MHMPSCRFNCQYFPPHGQVLWNGDVRPKLLLAALNEGGRMSLFLACSNEQIFISPDRQDKNFLFLARAFSRFQTEKSWVVHSTMENMEFALFMGFPFLLFRIKREVKKHCCSLVKMVCPSAKDDGNDLILRQVSPVYTLVQSGWCGLKKLSLSLSWSSLWFWRRLLLC